MLYDKIKIAAVVLLTLIEVGLGTGWAMHAMTAPPLPDEVATAPKDAEIAVRNLPVKVPFRDGKPMTVFTSQAEVAKTMGDEIAKQLASQVDFTKEHVVPVQWHTDGPPYGFLMYEIKKGNPPEVVFYV